MEKFRLQILGCGSALPTRAHNQSSQVLTIRDKMFMIDCGEGTMRQMRSYNVKISRLNHIFISHLHGDHCFGLIGLITTLGLLGRTSDLYIHSHLDLEKILQPLINYFCKGISFSIHFNPFNPNHHSLIYEDNSLKVFSIPLKHKVPTSGFLFIEKEKDLSVKKEMIDIYNIPIKEIQFIKKGADFKTEDGFIIPNKKLTIQPLAPKKYAYCSDTMYSEKIISYIEKIDCLFHEATFMEMHRKRAKETMHSTAIDAATIALKAQVKQLIIGHYSARYDDISGLLSEAQTIFENTSLSDEGRIFEF
jgi:ribonuclease Z